jgi:hypothetical protein
MFGRVEGLRDEKHKLEQNCRMYGYHSISTVLTVEQNLAYRIETIIQIHFIPRFYEIPNANNAR